MGEKIEYFFAALDMYLEDGLEPAQALAEAAADYAYVWNSNTPGTPVSKAAQRVLLHIEQRENSQQADDPRIEKLAALAHEMWAEWMVYMFHLGWQNDAGTWHMRADHYERWLRQARTNYLDLTEDEKASDREIARKILDALETM